MDEREAVLEVRCSEPSGDVVRSVRLTHLTLERMEFLWDKLGQFDVLFNDYTRGDFRAFFNHFVVVIDGEVRPAGLMWDVDDVGMFFLNEIKPCLSATAHFVFWDRRFRGREDLCRQMVEHVMKEYHLERIEVRVPVYANHTMRSVEKLGFIPEGRIRRAVVYKEKLFDVNIYSIVKDDLVDGWPERTERKLASADECWYCSSELGKNEDEPKDEPVLVEVTSGS